MPLNDTTAISVVPPPMSTTIVPIAAAMGSSIRRTSRDPADSAESRMAFRSSSVERHGTLTITLGLGRMIAPSCTFEMNRLSISLV